jgi:hypothetical protein
MIDSVISLLLARAGAGIDAASLVFNEHRSSSVKSKKVEHGTARIGSKLGVRRNADYGYRKFSLDGTLTKTWDRGAHLTAYLGSLYEGAGVTLRNLYFCKLPKK